MVTEILYAAAWYLISTLLGIIALPITFKLFQKVPGKGYALVRIFGLLLTGFVSWVLGSLGILGNNAGGILFAAALVSALSLLSLRGEGVQPLKHWIEDQWQAVVRIEIVFLLSFVGWALVRAYSPEILGTEKPMEFMFLNSILRSPSFPISDAWLSGHAISYYYFGYYLASIPARLSGAPSSVSFNLAQALWFALAASGALGIVIDLIILVKEKDASQKNLPLPSIQAAFPAAYLAPILLLLVGNLYGILGLANANGLFSQLKVPAIYYDFGGRLSEETGTISEPGISAGTLNFWEWLDLKQLSIPAGKPESLRLDLGNWFFAARVLHDRDLVGNEIEAIDENPAFSFLLGDLHPHVLALPFVLLAVSLSLEGLMTFAEKPYPVGELKAHIARLALAALILGSLLALNTWDFPIYAFLFMLAVLAGALASNTFKPPTNVDASFNDETETIPRPPSLTEILKRPALVLLLILLGSILLYLPFFTTFQSQAGGILPNVLTPTRFRQFFVMFAPVFAAALAFLVFLRIRLQFLYQRRTAWSVGGGILILLTLITVFLALAALQSAAAQPYISSFLSHFSTGKAFSLAAQRRLVDSLVAISAAAMLGISAGLVGGIFFRSNNKNSPNGQQAKVLASPSKALDSPATILALLMTAVGALLVLGPEFVYLRDNFGTRMNTLFKFYFQAWVLWSLVGAFGVWVIHHFGSGWGRRISLVIIGSLIMMGLVYLPASLWSKTGAFRGQPSLDGMAYFQERYPDEWAAVQWLQENAAENTIILEGTRGAYWLEGPSSRISMATGIPTVIGWVNHEAQWRGDYYSIVSGREGDVRTIYQSRDWLETERLLDLYGVEYVVVSDEERRWYQPLREAKFESYMQEVFRSGNLVIFRRLGAK